MAYIGTKPANQVVNSDQIADGAVGTADIADSAVTNVKITDSTITASKFASGQTPGFNGITFPASQIASANANTLDDYEEGTWTPGMQSQGGSISINTSNRLGVYTKVGNIVTAYCFAQVSSVSSPTGRFWITGLPFVFSQAFTGAMQHEGTSGSTPRLIPTCGSNDTRINIQGQGAGGTTDYASLVVANATFFVSVTYTTST